MQGDSVNNKKLISDIALKYKLSPILSHILANKIIQKEIIFEEITSFLDPKIKSYLLDPSLLLDMDKSTSYIANKIYNKEKIAVIADYDVDGACSAAMIKNFFTDLKQDIYIYIPDRIKDGYGPSVRAVDKIKSQKINTIVTLDCGISSFEVIDYANKFNIKSIIIDHHIGSNINPDAYAIINPNRFDEDFKYKNLSAAGVLFLFLIALNRKLKQDQYYLSNNINEIELLFYLDLVAISTICDVMSLNGLNRAYVKQGLNIINRYKKIKELHF